MRLEDKIMADRARQDFVKVQLKAGFGSAKIECGPFCFAFEAGKAIEVTRAEWNELLKDRGILELSDRAIEPSGDLKSPDRKSPDRK